MDVAGQALPAEGHPDAALAELRGVLWRILDCVPALVRDARLRNNCRAAKNQLTLKIRGGVEISLTRSTRMPFQW